MTTNRNIKKALFTAEKTVLIIMLVVVSFNTSINIMVSMLQAEEGLLTMQLILNLSFFGFLYLIIYAINQATTAIPLLISFNSPKRLLAKTVLLEAFIRSIIVTIIFLFVKLIAFRPGQLLTNSVFGIDLSSGNLVDTLIIIAIYFILVYLTYNLLLLISLMGVRYGWQVVLTIVFLVLGSCFVLFKHILLLIIFGWELVTFIVIIIALSIILSIVNYKVIKRFNYKY